MFERTPSRDQLTPATDEQIQADAVVEIKPFATKVVVVDYDQDWPALFEEEAATIRSALAGELPVHHVGSTSVPGLAAKPIIDMVLVVGDSSDEASYVPALENIGYELCIREPGWHEKRVLRKRLELGHDRNVNLHVLTVGCAEIQRYLSFRDWLRADPDDRERYAATKRELAKREWKYVQNYADAKTPVIEDIRRRAGGPKEPCVEH